MEELVGRDDELAALTAALHDAAAGRPGVALLLGEPGIGKTRLADELALRARGAGFRVLRGEADAGVRAPMELWRGLGFPLGGDPTLAAAERRWEHLDTLAAALVAAAPVVVVLDDVHWADDTAVWVLERLPRAVGDAAVLLVATSRDREPDMPALDGVRRVAQVLRLEGLSVAAVGQLASVDAAAAADLRERTGGNPLFVRELRHGDDGVVGSVLDRTLRRLDDDVQAVAAVAALAGPSAPLAVVAAAAGVTDAEATTLLEQAVREGVVHEVSATGVRFRHALLSDAAASSAPDPSAVHARLADAWSARPGLDPAATAAGHRLRADPSTEAVDAALALAAALVEEGRHPAAATLLRTAVDASGDARALLELADLLAWLGEHEAAVARYLQVTTVLDGQRDVDPTLRARAVIGRTIEERPFAPDPDLVRRLQASLDEIGTDDLALRALLLGRLAVFGGADLADEPYARSRAWAADAVAVARQAGDPFLIVRCLLDHHMNPASVAELDARVDAAGEVVALSERIGRGDLAIQGHQWRAVGLLNRGDLSGASAALAKGELLAELQPSPFWRYSTMVRRMPLIALTGDRIAATAMAAEATRLGQGAIDDLGRLGFEIEHRMMLVDLFGGTDPDGEALLRKLDEWVGGLPVPFLQVSIAHSATIFGNLDRATVLLRRVAGDLTRVVRSLGGDKLLLKLGEVAIRLGAADLAGSMYEALLPYAGRMNAGNGGSAGVPVDTVLAGLADLRGDRAGAVDHARAGLAMAEAMPSPPLVAKARAVLEALEGGAPASAPVPSAAAPGEASIVREGKVWVLTSPLGDARLPHSVGLTQLATLLARPGVEVGAVELAGATGEVPVANDLGPALDAQAKRAYRARLAELQAELDRADAVGNAARGAKAQAEIDALLQELERAVGLGGRDRPTGSGAEKARINVVRSLKRAVAGIAEQAPDLGRHLEVSLRTGRACAYDPEPAAALRWNIVLRG